MSHLVDSVMWRLERATVDELRELRDRLANLMQGWDDEGGAGVREPVHPAPPDSEAGAALEPPS